MNRELVRWGVPAVVLLLIFTIYTSVASIVLVSSGAPEAAAAAADGSSDSDPSDGDDASADGADDGTDVPATDGPTPAEETVGGVVVDTPLPETCEQLFSTHIVDAANSAGLVLNPSWAEGTDPGGLTLQDPVLAATLADAPSIDCRWLSPNGGNGVGIRSVVAVVSYDQALDLDTRFAELGYKPIDELGGARYVWESSSDGDRWGESHLVRGGLWFATHWLNYGPVGYTADMVGNHFG